MGAFSTPFRPPFDPVSAPFRTHFDPALTPFRVFGNPFSVHGGWTHDTFSRLRHQVVKERFRMWIVPREDRLSEGIVWYLLDLR